MRRLISIFIAAVILLGFVLPVHAADRAALDTAAEKTAAYVYNAVKNPQVDSVGGEWAVIGIARSGYAAPDSYYESYYRTVEKYVKDRNGVLHDKKYTEYSRVILGLTAAGYDPRSVAGYDLTLALGDFDKTVWQGVNGPVWALIALDSNNYQIPENKAAKTQATRDLYINEILARQTPDGGWNLTAGSSGAVGANEKGDADLTGMALQALAKYQGKAGVRAATEKALAFLSNLQDANGGYSSSFSSGSSAIESAVQVLVALCELGISPDDARFVKNGKTLIDNVLSYRNADGSFRHTADGSGNNQMSTEQALYGFVAAQRAADGKNSLYRMGDAVKRGEIKPAPSMPGLPGKHADVRQLPVTKPGATFTDTASHPNRTAIEALAAREIVGGKGGGKFDPDGPVTRAEFAKMITYSLGLPEKTSSPFTDVPSGQWYANPIATAYYYEIVTGVGGNKFNPGGSITRQEAAVMTARAARLAGMDTDMNDAAIRDTLAQFGDYRTVADWAKSSLAFCYSEKILDDSEFDIEPGKAATRAEIAEMIYRMLGRSNLL